ncbi:MAG: DUF4407 domain-containing protein [Acidobacteria bacterium]|nr:DUF4407 domain-containing protein [Acidobacteriota bacterium]
MAGPFKILLWRCAGATVSILKRPECETDHNKVAAIGATVLLTGILAGLTGGYAFYKTFKTYEAAVALGCFWGLLIFNIDRFMVMTIRKKDVSSLGRAGRVRAKAMEVFGSSPRLLLAVLLSLFITKPLELQLFAPEIDIEVEEIKGEMEKAARKLAEPPKPAPGAEGQQAPTDKAEALKAENANLIGEENAAYDEWQKLNELARKEKAGEKGSAADDLTGKPGPGRNYNNRMDAVRMARERYDKMVERNKKTIERNQGEIDRLSQTTTAIETTASNLRVAADGLAIRLAALSNLTSKDVREPYSQFDVYRLQGSVYRYANWGLIAIILLLELSPILSKIFSQYGSYERAVEAEEAMTKMAKEQELSRLQTASEVVTDSKEKRKQAILAFQGTLLDDLASEIPTVCADSKLTQAELEELRRSVVRMAISMTRRSLADMSPPHANGRG